METVLFRRNVMRTLQAKPVKLGMKYASRNTLRATTAKAVVCLRHSSGNLMHNLGAYILGLQFNQEMKTAAFTSMGDVGADLVMLCKLTKVHIPTATKRVKLSGTRTSALLQFDMLVNDLVGVICSGIFAGPKTTYVKKEVTLPGKGTKEVRDVEIIDVDAEKQLEEERLKTMRSILESVVDLYWRLCFNLFDQPPAAVFDQKVERMKTEFPELKFEETQPVVTAA